MNYGVKNMRPSKTLVICALLAMVSGLTSLIVMYTVPDGLWYAFGIFLVGFAAAVIGIIANVCQKLTQKSLVK